MIHVKDLIRIYKAGKLEVISLRGVNLDVAKGETVAIVGPSGSGKTTLLNLVGGLDRPTAGSILVDGVEVSKLTNEELVTYRREKVGFVFQFFNLVPWLSAVENVELPMLAAGKPPKERRQRAKELMSSVGILDRSLHKPDELSGGEQQRVAIAAALANDPPLLLADEPTGELDTQTGTEVLDLFRLLKEEYGKTEVIATHDRRVAKIADRVMRIEDGLITGEETLEMVTHLDMEEVEKENQALRLRIQKMKEQAKHLLE